MFGKAVWCLKNSGSYKLGAPFGFRWPFVLPSKGLENLGPDALIPQKNPVSSSSPSFEPDLPNASLEKLAAALREAGQHQAVTSNECCLPVCSEGRCQEGDLPSPPSPQISGDPSWVSKSLWRCLGLNPNFHLPVLTQKLLQSHSEQLRGKFTMLSNSGDSPSTPHPISDYTHTPCLWDFICWGLGSESWVSPIPKVFTKPRDVFFSWNSVHTCYFSFLPLLCLGQFKKRQKYGV